METEGVNNRLVDDKHDFFSVSPRNKGVFVARCFPILDSAHAYQPQKACFWLLAFTIQR
jgi:hypothetical protein